MSISSKDITEKNVKSVDFEANSSKMLIFCGYIMISKLRGKLIRKKSHL